MEGSQLEVKMVESRWQVQAGDVVYGRYNSETEAKTAAKDWEDYYKRPFLF